MNSSSSKENQGKNLSWRSILIWISLALLLRWQVIEPRWIPSGSMLPTLRLQDRILIEKLSPRFSHLQNKHLKHDTVIVFNPPKALVEAGYAKNQALIKRVVGLPGDKIEIINGNIYRNDLLIKESWRSLPIKYEMQPVIIPLNELWVLGDNRNNSLDSHIWGPLPEKNVIGTAIWRYWPVKDFGPIRVPPTKKIGK